MRSNAGLETRRWYLVLPHPIVILFLICFAERAFRSINELARYMLVAAELPDPYWEVAVSYAVLIRNILSNIDGGYVYMWGLAISNGVDWPLTIVCYMYLVLVPMRWIIYGWKVTVLDRSLVFSLDSNNKILLPSSVLLTSQSITFSSFRVMFCLINLLEGGSLSLWCHP